MSANLTNRTMLLASLYRVNKEAKYVRDVRTQLKEFLFYCEGSYLDDYFDCDSKESSPLFAFAHANNIRLCSEYLEGLDGRVHFLAELSSPRRRDVFREIWSVCSEMDESFDEEEIAEYYDKMVALYESDRKELHVLHVALITLKQYSYALYDLKDSAIKQLGLKCCAIHKSQIDGRYYRLFREGVYGFHSPIDEDEFIDPVEVVDQALVHLISSEINEELSLGLSIGEAIQNLAGIAPDAARQAKICKVDLR